MTPEVASILKESEVVHPRDEAITSAIPELLKFLPEWAKTSKLSIAEFFTIWSRVHTRLFPIPTPPRDEEIDKKTNELSRYVLAWAERYHLSAIEAAYVLGVIHHKEAQKQCLLERGPQ